MLHIGTEMAWRGGENQISLLIDGLLEQSVESYIAYPLGSQALQRINNVSAKIGFQKSFVRKFFEIQKIANFCIEHKIELIDLNEEELVHLKKNDCQRGPDMYLPRIALGR